MDDRVDLNALFQSFERLRAYLDAYVENKGATATAAALLPDFAPLVQLEQRFQLSHFEQLLLWLGLALELEPNLQSLCARAQGSDSKPYATLGLALAMLPDAHWSVLSPQCPLHYWRLIQTERQVRLTDEPLSIDRRILCYLLGQPALDEYLADRVTPITPTAWISEASLPPSHGAIAQQMVALWSNELNAPMPIALCSSDAAMAQSICIQVCECLGLQLMALATTLLPTDPHELRTFQRHWEREAILSNSVLLLDGDTNPDPSHRSAIALFLDTLTTPVVYSGQDRPPQLRRGGITFDIPSLSPSEQLALWQHHLGEVTEDLKRVLPRLASQFQLTPRNIQTVCRQFEIQNSKFKILFGISVKSTHFPNSMILPDELHQLPPGKT